MAGFESGGMPPAAEGCGIGKPIRPYEITKSTGAPTPLVFASPHSGRYYPEDFLAAAVLGTQEIRQSEDVLVDSLLAGAAACGVPLLTATYARAYIDVNRSAYELDQAMFEDELPDYAVRSARVAAGLGSIARVVADGQEIYRAKLFYAEAKARIEEVHQPYHEALQGLVDLARSESGSAVLLDWHSMPSSSSGHPRGFGPDVILGDRFGSSCDPIVTRRIEEAFQRRGYAVARNVPFAGGFTTEAYGRPSHGVHAVQIELNRRLYLDESNLQPVAGFRVLERDLAAIIRELTLLDWGTIRRARPLDRSAE